MTDHSAGISKYVGGAPKAFHIKYHNENIVP